MPHVGQQVEGGWSDREGKRFTFYLCPDQCIFPDKPVFSERSFFIEVYFTVYKMHWSSVYSVMEFDKCIWGYLRNHHTVTWRVSVVGSFLLLSRISWNGHVIYSALGHSSCFRVFVVMNKLSEHSWTISCIDMVLFLLDKYLGVELFRSYNRYIFNFVRHCQTFCNLLFQFTFPYSMYKHFSCPTSLLTFAFSHPRLYLKSS